jgi:UDP-3-O-[3-hydroxymyristoyl] glucosamine N-acyltransferase
MCGGMAKTTLGALAVMIGATVPYGADPETGLVGISSLTEATGEQVSFCSDVQYLAQLSVTRAAVVIVPRRLKVPAVVKAALLVVDESDLAVNKVLEYFAPPIPRPGVGVDPMARVDATATLAEGVRVGPFVTVGARTRMGKGCVLHPGVHLGEDVVLGEGCELFANVVVRERCTLGNRVVVHANSTIGSDGFGYRWDGRRHAKVPQIGVVLIGDDVEIGSNSCVDRAKFAATVVGPGTKIDNLVQVAHNVRTGAHCIITGQVGLAGSVVLGNGVVLGGQSAVRDHIQLGDGAMVAACSAVAEDVEAKMVVSGLPALPHRQSLREQAALRRLPELVQQMRKVQDDIETLQAAIGGGEV